MLVEFHFTFSLVKQTAGNNGIEYICKIENPITIMSDKNMLATIVMNLILKSIKFTHMGGTFVFEAKELEEHVDLLISDTRVGMCEKQ